MTDRKSGTIVSSFQLDETTLTVTCYWGSVNQSFALEFADKTEFRNFMRDLEKFGRRLGYLPARKVKRKATHE